MAFANAAGMQQAMKSLGIKPGDEAFTKGSQLWEMMDDMAASDPAAYKKFIAKQMAEQEKMTKANAPPTPVFAIRLQDEVSKRTVVVNFSESTRVKQPETSESDIPIVVQPPEDEVDKQGVPILLYEAAFHPTVMERVGLDQ
eukprot:gene15318-20833_t